MLMPRSALEIRHCGVSEAFRQQTQLTRENPSDSPSRTAATLNRSPVVAGYNFKIGQQSFLVRCPHHAHHWARIGRKFAGNVVWSFRGS